MKKGPVIALCLLVLIVISCNKIFTGSDGILIKGTIPSSEAKKGSGFSTDASAYTLSDAARILVFNSSGEYEMFAIKDSTFAARALQGTAVALVFLAEDNSVIGSLQSGGLNVLPLVSLSDDENTVIDLSSLHLEGNDVLSSYNPLGTEIILNDEEIERFRQFGSFFRSLAQNIDADADGKADILDKKELFVSTMHNIYCGNWGLNDTPPVLDTANIFINYQLRIWGGKNLMPESQALTLYGPEGSPDAVTLSTSRFAEAPDGFITFFSQEVPAPGTNPFGSILLPFDNGSYVLTIDNNTYRLNYSMVDARYLLVLAIPTVHTNENGEITSVTVEYRDLNNEQIIPENFIYQTMVQLGGNNTQLCQIGSIWEAPRAKKNTELYNFIPPVPVSLSDLIGVNVSYVDLVGNSYSITFNKE